jgi:chromosome segregation ATPase
MGLITDLLKDIPLSAVLREKMASAEQKYAALDTENAILKDDKRELQVRVMELERQVGDLKQEIEKLTHVGDDLDEVEILLLRALTSPEISTPEQMVGIAGSNLTRVQYHLHRLVEANYVFYGPVGTGIPGPLHCYLTHEGREYLIKRDKI